MEQQESSAPEEQNQSEPPLPAPAVTRRLKRAAIGIACVGLIFAVAWWGPSGLAHARQHFDGHASTFEMASEKVASMKLRDVTAVRAEDGRWSVSGKDKLGCYYATDLTERIERQLAHECDLSVSIRSMPERGVAAWRSAASRNSDSAGKWLDAYLQDEKGTAWGIKDAALVVTGLGLLPDAAHFRYSAYDVGTLKDGDVVFLVDRRANVPVSIGAGATDDLPVIDCIAVAVAPVGTIRTESNPGTCERKLQSLEAAGGGNFFDLSLPWTTSDGG
ncbi:hypothetical protein LG293_17875 (plasmid) [Citricoccus nitrophenolicus]